MEKNMPLEQNTANEFENKVKELLSEKLSGLVEKNKINLIYMDTSDGSKERAIRISLGTAREAAKEAGVTMANHRIMGAMSHKLDGKRDKIINILKEAGIENNYQPRSSSSTSYYFIDIPISKYISTEGIKKLDEKLQKANLSNEQVITGKHEEIIREPDHKYDGAVVELLSAISGIKNIEGGKIELSSKENKGKIETIVSLQVPIKPYYGGTALIDNALKEFAIDSNLSMPEQRNSDGTRGESVTIFSIPVDKYLSQQAVVELKDKLLTKKVADSSLIDEMNKIINISPEHITHEDVLSEVGKQIGVKQNTGYDIAPSLYKIAEQKHPIDIGAVTQYSQAGAGKYI